MTKSIDERVVEMQFNNKQFESGISTSLKSIDKLKAGLNFDKAANSLSSLERAGHSFSLAGISDTLDAVSNKFSAMGIIGITVLQNLTNTAVNAGKNIVKALTIEPIKTGVEEYETKMNAITTILTNTKSKGTTLDDVTKTLDELNTYADKTIYNFAEMTKNIGTFTAAGIGLEQSAMAIKGIANLGAGSGSSPLQVSTAMYQLSQALASGTVKLIDWNSVVNAGMGGELFQNALKESAKELGVFVDASKPFRETLEQGWLTSEVLTKTLTKFANDPDLIKAATQVKTFTQLLSTMKESMQSGWAQSWENIIGDKDQAAEFFTSINDGFNNIVGASADARNATLTFWKANGGRAAVIEGLASAFKGLQSILKPIGEAFRETFPSVTGKQLIEISKAFRDLMAGFKIGPAMAENLKSTFKGLFAVLDIAKQLFGGLAIALGSIIKFIFPVTNSFLAFSGTIGDFLVAIDEALKSSNAFTNIMKKFGSVLLPIVDGLRLAIIAFFNALASVASVDLSGFEVFSKRLQTTIKPFEILSEIAKNLGTIFYNLAGVIGVAFEKLREFIAGSFNVANFNALFDAINSGLFAAILISIKKFVDSLSSLSSRAGGILGGITGTLDGVSGSLQALQSSLKAGTLMKIAISLGILAAALFTIAQIDSKKLTSSLGAITGLFLELFGAMAGFELIMGVKGFLAMFQITAGMIGLSVAILILASAMKKMSELDWKGVGTGLAAIAGMSVVLIASSKLLAGSSSMLIRTSLGFIVFSIAINILAKAVKELGKLDAGALTRGLVGIGVLLVGLALFMRATNLSGMGMIKTVGVLILAGAITVLAGAVKELSAIKTGDLVKGLTGLAVVLTGIAAFTKVVGNPAGLVTTSIALTILGAAILLIAEAVVKMGSISWEEMSRGLLVMAGSLGLVTIAIHLLPKSMFLKSVALIDVAGALVVLASALKTMAKLSWDEIARSLTVLSVSLGLIIGMFIILKQSDLVDSTAFLIMSFGITILAKSLKTLGSMSIAQLTISLIALAGIFAIIGGATILLTPLIPAILGLAAALIVFSVAVLGIGAGVLMLSTGLTALAVAGTSVSVALVAVVTSIVGTIPFIFKTLAQGMVEFIKGLASGAGEIADSVVTLGLALVKALAKLIPGLVGLVGKLITSLLTLILKYMPKIIDTGMKCIIAFLKGMAKHIKEVVATAILVIVNFIEGVASMLPKLIQAAFDLMVAFITGLADAVEKNTPIVLAAIIKLMLALPKAILNMIGSVITSFFEIGVNIVQGMINGIKSMISAVSKSVGDIGSSVVKSAKAALGIRSPSSVFRDEVGKMIGEGMALGIAKSTPKAVTASTQMSNAVIKAGKNAFDKAIEWINNEKYYGRLSLKEELACWQSLQTKYKQGTEERIKADKEFHRTWWEMYRAEYDASVKWISDRKYYNELGLTAELAAWTRVQKRYLEGTKERSAADKEVYRLQQEIGTANKDYAKQIAQVQEEGNTKRKDLEDDYYAKTTNIKDKLVQDIRSVSDEYENAVKSRSESLYSAYGLFDKVDSKAVSGTQLLRNLKGQVNAFESWQANINSLAGKGISSDLIKELTNMGPQSANQIAALNKLSAAKLDEYVSLWETKHRDANNVATAELESMRVTTLDKIKEINKEAKTELADAKTAWTQEMISINTDVITQISALQTEFATKMGTATAAAGVEFAAMGTNIQTTVTAVKANTEQEVTSLTQNIKSIISGTDWVSLGVNIIQGISQGIRSKSTDLANEAARTALAALKAAKAALGIHSPSTAFAEVGAYAIDGFVKGLTNVTDVVSSAKAVGNTAVNSLKGAISNLTSSVSGDLSLSPTIRPVLDLTNVEAGKSRLDSIFNGQGGINVSSVNGKIASVTSGKATILNEVASVLSEIAKDKTNQNGGSISFEGLFKDAIFQVRSDDDIPKIAKEVLQRLYDMERGFSRGRGLATT